LEVMKEELNLQTISLRLLGNLNGTYTVTQWVNIKGLIGMDYRNNRDKRFESIIANPSSGGNAREYLSTTANFNAQLTANFVKTFNDVHAIDGFVGAEYRRDYDRFFGTRGDGIAAGFNVIDATAEPVDARGFTSEYRLASYFGSVSYEYDDRYRLQFTARYDGSSKFGVENRWGLFPSISGFWRISEE